MTSRKLFPLAVLPALVLAACQQEEAPPAPEATASEAAAMTAVESWIAGNFDADVGGATDSLLYSSAEVDLDGDGTDEVLAYVGGPMLCGTGGCNLLVLKREGTNFLQVGSLSVVQLPVGVLDSKTNGWRDLAVSVSGGGRAGGIMRVPFDGESYAGNPTVAPAEPVSSIGTELIAAEPLKPLGAQ